MSFVVGVDSGGTHTNIRVASLSEDGSDDYNIELDRALGATRSERELREVFAEVLAAVKARVRDDAVSMWINAAGYAPSTRVHFEAIVRDAAAEVSGAIGVSNDAVGLLLSHEPEMVAVVAGTGSVAMARRTNGDVVVRGGEDWVVTDQGSAFWIGLDGIRAAYTSLEGGTDTGLIRCLVEHYSPLDHNASDEDVVIAIREISRKLAALGSGTKPTIASFARQVTRQAELGDQEAQRIVKSGAEDLARAASKVYRDLAALVTDRVVAPRFLLRGSVAYRSPFYAEAFRSALAQFLFDVRENVEHEVELSIEPNGLPEAMDLAKRLAEDGQVPQLDVNHPFSVIPCR
jgi:N-acetylglucosamine kinase-like BadF-type ATPase